MLRRSSENLLLHSCEIWLDDEHSRMRTTLQQNDPSHTRSSHQCNKSQQCTRPCSLPAQQSCCPDAVEQSYTNTPSTNQQISIIIRTTCTKIIWIVMCTRRSRSKNMQSNTKKICFNYTNATRWY